MLERFEADANLVGDLADCYREVQRLGDGAEGGALAATERVTGRRVVLKRVPAERARAVRHAFGVLRRAGSPHLPAPHALHNAVDGSVWMATDWVPGVPLPLAKAATVADALAEARAVAHALAAIHGAGTHHGDVAPANVVVTATGGVVLVDLGQLGRHGMGTPGFIAPEVLAGGGGPAADRFSLGAILCLRLLGEAPWQRPETLLRVAGPAQVAARLEQLGASRLDPPIRELLLRLLDPRPDQRLADPHRLVTMLGRLHAAADAGLDLRRSSPWWRPNRWPYHGGSLADAAERLTGEARPALVAVAGPPGSGRGRVVEELVQTLQTFEGALDARTCEPDRLSAMLGRPGVPWLEAWRTSEAASVVGVVEPPPWDGGLAAAEAAASRAAVLLQLAATARATVVLPVEPELGEVLAARGVVVVTIEPWSVSDVERVLDGVVDPSQRVAWAQCLHAATGGWPARVVRAAEACAEAELAEPDAAAVGDALAAAGEAEGLRLDLGTARAVMLAVWGEPGGLASLPPHLHDGERPWATAEAAARRRLGAELRERAVEVAEVVQAQGEALPLALALDADVPAEIERGLRVLEHEPAPLGHWLDAGGAARLSAAAVTGVMHQRLAAGRIDAALRLAPHASGAAGRLLAARARQRKGDAAGALAEVEVAVAAEDPAIHWAARGLTWRLWIDQGQGARAHAEAIEALAVAPRSGVGPATAFLWAAMAALVIGEHEQAERWLADVVAAVADVDDRDAAGLRARAHQLHGNLAQARGQLRTAQQRYALAAEAFEAAAEPVGGLMLRGSLAGLAVLSLDIAEGIEHGRAAIGGLLARGQLSATLEAGINLLQLLVRTGAEREAHALLRLLDELHRPGGSALTLARLDRGRAELAAARLRPTGRGGLPRGAELAGAESRFVSAATHLQAAAAAGEAAEAWRRAAALARAQGQLDRALDHLAPARAAAGDDADALAEVELETAMVELSREDPAAWDAALARLAALSRPEAWCERGRVDLAIAYDRALLSALRRRLPSEHPARLRVARRWLSTLELVMKQTGPLDRSAVRSTLLLDSGDPQPLRDLLAELDEPMPVSRPVPAASPAPAGEHDRLEQLMRIYRRLAREDRLDLLLQQVVDAMMDLTDAERGAVVVLPTAHTERLEVTRELAEGSEGVRFSRSVIERVLADGEPVLSVDAAADDRFDGSRSISHLNLRSVLAVPLQFRGERLGAAYVDHRLRRGNFDEQDLARMEEFAELAALAVAHARALAELRAQATALRTQQAELSRLLEVREAEVLGLREEVRAQGPAPRGYRGIIGGTEVMARLFRLVDRIADADVPVVIHGESGTGKELVARAIHDAGSRSGGPFIAENCGAIPETLLESVLFGHAKGAFTGAGSAKAGLFEAADKGTIFLDEVGEMSPAMQTKLLRVLQEGELRRVGENRSRPIDVRVIAASNRDLEAMVERGEFRRDLYYRINVVKIELPPLRQRVDDLPALVECFLARHGDPQRPLRVTAAAMRRLAQHDWPGNVRELENEVQRWVALVEGEVRPEDLSMGPATGASAVEAPPMAELDDLQIRPRVDHLERALIDEAMARTGGNQTRAAELLGLSRYGLQKKLRRLAEPNADAADRQPS